MKGGLFSFSPPGAEDYFNKIIQFKNQARLGCFAFFLVILFYFIFQE
jgi:hypothetical protein